MLLNNQGENSGRRVFLESSRARICMRCVFEWTVRDRLTANQKIAGTVRKIRFCPRRSSRLRHVDLDNDGPRIGTN